MQRRTPIQSILDTLNRTLSPRSYADGVQLYGVYTFDIKRADGTREVRQFKNLIMDAGEDEAAKLLVGLTASPFTYIALGTDDDPAPADSQTALNAEVTTNGGERTEDETPTTSGNVASVSVTFTFSDALALVEVALFNDVGGEGHEGDMFSRQIFDVINVKASDQMTITWNLTLGTSRA